MAMMATLTSRSRAFSSRLMLSRESVCNSQRDCTAAQLPVFLHIRGGREVVVKTSVTRSSMEQLAAIATQQLAAHESEPFAFAPTIPCSICKRSIYSHSNMPQ
mmetsp:Transcript_18142/g.43628  ORF Transcript_18142/g.43628 Transcript_18142/m.43628 type:complete len:103 (+) Transcript_18142:354-662(+)